MKNYIKNYKLKNRDKLDRLGLELHQMILTQTSVNIIELLDLSKEIEKYVEIEVRNYFENHSDDIAPVKKEL